MKEKLTRNIGLKILSIILAALLWLVITNVEDPISTGSFKKVAVNVLNENEIKSKNQAYQIIEGKTIDFSFAARRSIKDELTVSDFKVTADLSKLSDFDTVTINISCPNYGDKVTITDGANQVMKVEREQLGEDSFNVNVKIKGEPADGYYVAGKSTNMLITVSGPQSKIDSIAEIVAEVDVTGVKGSLFRTNEIPKAFDEKGNEIDSSNLKFSEAYVPINIDLYRTQTIDLLITATGKPLSGYVMTALEYQPKKIEIAAEDTATLNSIPSLSVTENIDGASQNIEKNINLQDQLPDGIILVGDNQTATIKITIEQAVTKEVIIQPDDIEKRNLPTTLNLVYMSTVPIILQLSGSAEEMADITAKSITPYIDLTNFSSGTYDVTVNVDAPENISLVNNPTVSTYLINK